MTKIESNCHRFANKDVPDSIYPRSGFENNIPIIHRRFNVPRKVEEKIHKTQNNRKKQNQPNQDTWIKLETMI